MDQINLKVSESVRETIEAAFEEAQKRLTARPSGFDPFTVTAVDGGLEYNDHPCATPTAVRESVKMLLAQDMPEGYSLCYDGYVYTDDGNKDAIIVEAAGRGSEKAYCLALLYTRDPSSVTFETDYAYACDMEQLYPAGTKPIVSGLATLDMEQDDFDDDLDFDESEDEATESAPALDEE